MDSKTLLDNLLQMSPQEIDDWMSKSTPAGPVNGMDFNWDLFAFCAASRAREERSLQWASIALRIYEGLAERSPPDHTSSFLFSAMNLRAWMIVELGPKADDAVLDPELIVAYVKQSFTLPLEEAAAFASSRDLHGTPIEKIQEMRRIKNALGVLEGVMEEAEILQKHPELAQWLQLKSDLP